MNLILEKYDIVREFSAGNMAKVYLVKDILINKLYVLKYIDISEKLLNSEEAEREYKLKSNALSLEFNVLKELDDRRFPYVVNYESADNYTALVMEYIEGINFEEYISKNSPLNLDELVNYMSQIIDIMVYLHSKHPPILYRDLKPSNLIINDKGIIKLIDFGAVSANECSDLYSPTSYGTYGYCSKEQLESLNLTLASDVYSMGAIFNYMISGINPALPPFEKADIGREYYYIPVQLANLINKCCETNYKNRYQNAMELKLAFDKISLKNRRISISYFFYYIILVLAIFITEYSLWKVFSCNGNYMEIINSLLILLISFGLRYYLDRKYYNSYFIKKRIFNIIYTTKRKVGL